MPLILTIDTSSEACSVALEYDGSLLENYQIMPRLHARLLLSMIEDLLGDAGLSFKQLDALAFTRGPGSFTGLRIAASAVQGLAYGADLPVIPVSTLATLAQGAYRETGCKTVLPVMDANMKEFYWGHFEIIQSIAVLQGKEQLTSPDEIRSTVPRDGQSKFGVGRGWQFVDLFPESLRAGMSTVLPDCYPRAKDALAIATDLFGKGLIVAPEEALPVYLRGKNAWQKKKAS